MLETCDAFIFKENWNKTEFCNPLWWFFWNIVYHMIRSVSNICRTVCPVLVLFDIAHLTALYVSLDKLTLWEPQTERLFFIYKRKICLLCGYNNKQTDDTTWVFDLFSLHANLSRVNSYHVHLYLRFYLIYMYLLMVVWYQILIFIHILWERIYLIDK